jgi:hypothetical protein
VQRSSGSRWFRRRSGSAPPPVVWREPGRAPSATPALVAGILGSALPVLLPAAVAWWLGRTARREIAASGGQLSGRGAAIAASVLAVYSVVATVAVVAGALS